MLKQRVVTALILVFIVLGAIIGLSYPLFQIFLGFVVGLAAWEWSALAGLNTILLRSIYTFFIILTLFFGLEPTDELLNSILMLSLLWWGLSFFFIYFYPKYSLLWKSRGFVALAGFFVLYPCWLAILYLRLQSEFIFHIVMLFGIVAAADIGAYFSGRTFGKHKLAPQVSPKKTWEGVWGGMLACCLLVLVTAVSSGKVMGHVSILHYAGLLICALVLAAFSVIGDLMESMLKRIRGIKDSGNILPGHGGILDRIDGIVAVAPLYAFFLINFGTKLS